MTRWNKGADLIQKWQKKNHARERIWGISGGKTAVHRLKTERGGLAPLPKDGDD